MGQGRPRVNVVGTGSCAELHEQIRMGERRKPAEHAGSSFPVFLSSGASRFSCHASEATMNCPPNSQPRHTRPSLKSFVMVTTQPPSASSASFSVLAPCSLLLSCCLGALLLSCLLPLQNPSPQPSRLGILGHCLSLVLVLSFWLTISSLKTHPAP